MREKWKLSFCAPTTRVSLLATPLYWIVIWVSGMWCRSVVHAQRRWPNTYHSILTENLKKMTTKRRFSCIFFIFLFLNIYRFSNRWHLYRYSSTQRPHFTIKFDKYSQKQSENQTEQLHLVCLRIGTVQRSRTTFFLRSERMNVLCTFQVPTLFERYAWISFDVCIRFRCVQIETLNICCIEPEPPHSEFVFFSRRPSVETVDTVWCAYQEIRIWCGRVRSHGFVFWTNNHKYAYLFLRWPRTNTYAGDKTPPRTTQLYR